VFKVIKFYVAHLFTNKVWIIMIQMMWLRYHTQVYCITQIEILKKFSKNTYFKNSELATVVSACDMSVYKPTFYQPLTSLLLKKIINHTHHQNRANDHLCIATQFLGSNCIFYYVNILLTTAISQQRPQLLASKTDRRCTQVLLLL
jgi:hypothetical protein